MPGRKGQRSGGHNKKDQEQHERDGTRNRSEDSGVPAGALDSVYAITGNSVNGELRKLQIVKDLAYEKWRASLENGDPDKELRMCYQTASARYDRLACELAREKPKEDLPQTTSDGATLTMADLVGNRNGNGAS